MCIRDRQSRITAKATRRWHDPVAGNDKRKTIASHDRTHSTRRCRPPGGLGQFPVGASFSVRNCAAGYHNPSLKTCHYPHVNDHVVQHTWFTPGIGTNSIGQAVLPRLYAAKPYATTINTAEPSASKKGYPGSLLAWVPERKSDEHPTPAGQRHVSQSRLKNDAFDHYASDT